MSRPGHKTLRLRVWLLRGSANQLGSADFCKRDDHHVVEAMAVAVRVRSMTRRTG